MLERNASAAENRFSAQYLGGRDDTAPPPAVGSQILGHHLPEGLALNQHLHFPRAVHKIHTFPRPGCGSPVSARQDLRERLLVLLAQRKREFNQYLHQHHIPRTQPITHSFTASLP